MNTYLVTSLTNHGETSCVVNARDEEDVCKICRDNDYIWPGYDVELVDTTTRGVVAGHGKASWEDRNE